MKPASVGKSLIPALCGLLVALLTVGLILADRSVFAAEDGGGSYTLQVSKNSDRSAAGSLAGATVAGKIYAFTAPDEGASQVKFWLDDPNKSGTPRQVEKAAPYDFSGGTVSAAKPFDTTGISEGKHTITAEVTLSGGATETFSAEFIVQNQPAPPAGGYDLEASGNSDRSAPQKLAGATVSGKTHIFTAPDAGVSKVEFWLGDPQMQSAPYRTEKAAPYDLAGGSVSTANPLDTTKLPDGEHVVTAKVYLSGGGAEVASSKFTVDNVPDDPGGSGPGGVFLGQNGSVVMEIESSPPTDSWKLETEKPGYTGSGYYAWRGPNKFSTPGSGLLTYEFHADEGGIYQFDLRNRRDKDGRTVAGDQENDVFARMDGGPWLKVFSSAAFDSWNWATKFDLSHDNKPDASYDLTQGLHTLELSGRSSNFKLDRIHLHKSGSPSVTAPESPRSE